MFVFLSKKIAIPNNIRLNSIAWNKKQGYIAVGGEDGLLKVLRAESNTFLADPTNSSTKNRSTTSTSNLSMNQTLEGHNGHIQVVAWNEEHQKLTSSDQNGVIIVWMLYKGSWYEEMINNRNKSVVRGMAWSSDGQKICIVYEDGAVIVGSVEGSRIWGKELKGISLTTVQWSADTKYLLFGSKNGEALLYDDQGTFLTKLDVVDNGQAQGIVALNWYDGRNGYTAIDCPVIAVAFQSGRICLLRDVIDDTPINVDTKLTIVCCVWNTFGSWLAVAGIDHQDRRENVVCFFSAFGEPLKTLRIPGKEISGCSWENGSLRMCISVDSNIYFANIRPNYKWAYFSNTIVFTDEKIHKNGVCVTFWNTITNARHFKYFKCVMNIAAYGEHCVIAAMNDVSQEKESFILFVCNAISTPVDIKHLDYRPSHIALNNSLVIAATRNNFQIWNFRAPRNSALNTIRLRKDRSYHIDDIPTGATEILQDQEVKGLDHSKDTTDPICVLGLSDKLLLIGRDSGMIQQYLLPQVSLTRRYIGASKPRKLVVNCNSTRAAVIDCQGVLRLLEFDASSSTSRSDQENKVQEEYVLPFERKDTWAICWAEDNPELLAIMEKNRMYVFRGTEPEEPMTCSGYICCFRELEILCVLLDELVYRPENARKELLQKLDVKSLRDTRELLTRVGLQEAEEFIRENSHPRLWRLLGEHALRQLELEVAEAAMVRCADYLGIRFVKRLHGVHEVELRRAEVLAFLGDYEAAERIYLELDRRDLAISLCEKLADHERALQLMMLANGSSAADAHVQKARLDRGEQLATQQRWHEARELLERGRGLERLLECHYRLEEYEELAAVASQFADRGEQSSGALARAARMLASLGMCQQAVACLVRCGNVRLAVETCIRSNRWNQALELARTWQLPGIGELLGKYVRHLLDRGRLLQAVELYRKAERPVEAARLLLDLAAEQARRRAPPLRVKKLYVLAVLLVQDLRPSATQDEEERELAERGWRGAEAYHFLLLAHRQLYDGEAESAMCSALRLREYEELLDTELVYSLLALASASCQAFATCSRALVRLEAFDVSYEELSFELFTRRLPHDAKPATRSECVSCETYISNYCTSCPNCSASFSPCIVSGKSLTNPASSWLCTVCKHRAASERDVVNISGCPLCHSIITYM